MNALIKFGLFVYSPLMSDIISDLPKHCAVLWLVDSVLCNWQKLTVWSYWVVKPISFPLLLAKLLIFILMSVSFHPYHHTLCSKYIHSGTAFKFLLMTMEVVPVQQRKAGTQSGRMLELCHYRQIVIRSAGAWVQFHGITWHLRCCWLHLSTKQLVSNHVPCFILCFMMQLMCIRSLSLETDVTGKRVLWFLVQQLDDCWLNVMHKVAVIDCWCHTCCF